MEPKRHFETLEKEAHQYRMAKAAKRVKVEMLALETAADAEEAAALVESSTSSTSPSLQLPSAEPSESPSLQLPSAETPPPPAKRRRRR